LEQQKQENTTWGIGKGIKALLGTDHEDSLPTPNTSNKNEVHQLPIAKILPNPEQPRKIFSDDDLMSLAKSIAVDGVLQPIVVCEDPGFPGKWILIAGERRLRASKLAGLTEIPAIIKNTDGESKLRLALIENIQRASLNVIEEAQAYERLINTWGLSQLDCAQKVGKERATVANIVRLLQLPLSLQSELAAGRLSAGHGKALLMIVDHPQLLQVAELIISKNLNVRQAEKLCKKLQKHGTLESNNSPAPVRTDIEYVASSLRGYLQTKVNVRGTAQRGKIEISFFSTAELERLMGLMGAKL
jgi:ParB family transcriptional regulator, chromosome partitioning protein